MSISNCKHGYGSAVAGSQGTQDRVSNTPQHSGWSTRPKILATPPLVIAMTLCPSLR